MVQFIVFLLSVGTASLLFSKRYKVIPLYMFVVFLFTLDYANFYLKIDSSLSGYMIKIYAEILFLFTVVYFFVRTSKIGKAKNVILVIFVFVVVTIVIGMSYNGVLNAILVWRSSILPIMLPLLLCYSKIVTIDTMKKLMKFVCVLTLLNTSLALFQYITFNGDPQSSWRYDFLVDARQNNESNTEERFVTYQIVREDKLRASGVFVSALHYSYLAALSAFYVFLQMMAVRKNKFIFYSLYSTLFIFFVAGMLASQVRASLIMLALCLISYFFCTNRSLDNIYFSVKKTIALIVVSYTALFAVLFKFGADSLDASAAGRAPQYIKAISDFSVLGAGLGKYRGQFDSDIVYGVITFGVFYFIIPLVFINLFKKAYSKQVKQGYSNNAIVILGFCVAISVAIVSLFQHLSGSIFYYVAWLLLITSATRKSSNFSKSINQLPTIGSYSNMVSK